MAVNQDEISIIRWIKLKDKLQGISKSSIDRWEKKGKFPKRIHLGDRIVGWIEREVNEWLIKKANER